MDDEGVLMFKSYRNEWIPDTPARRKAILDAMRNWDAYSNSSPREGILAAIDTFYDPNKKISLYVYSDDFAVGTINAVVREIDRRNTADASGKRRVRIHAVAFPTIYQATGGQLYTAADFATSDARHLPAQRRHVRRAAAAARRASFEKRMSVMTPPDDAAGVARHWFCPWRV